MIVHSGRAGARGVAYVRRYILGTCPLLLCYPNESKVPLCRRQGLFLLETHFRVQVWLSCMLLRSRSDVDFIQRRELRAAYLVRFTSALTGIMFSLRDRHT